MSEWYKKIEPPDSMFWAYFDIADELCHSGSDSGHPDPITMVDFEQEFRQKLEEYAFQAGLPWPPDMTTAEDASLNMNLFEYNHREGTSLSSKDFI